MNSLRDLLINLHHSTELSELLIQYGHRHLLLDLSPFDIPEDIASKLVDEVIFSRKH